MRTNWVATVAFVGALAAFPAVASAQFTETQKGTGVGALLGAGTGAIVGAAVHHPVAGTFIGAGIGGVGGYAVGHELEQQQTMNYENRRAIVSQQQQIELQRREIQQLQQVQSTE
ncbi:MAG: glycine zipper domain-containing protein [Candidatus Binataceae bacterium]|jgi:outer membrane lipoprotein SlyB